MNTPTFPRRAAIAALFVTSVVVAAACGSSNGNPAPTGTGGHSTIVGSTSTTTSSSGTTSSSSSASTSTTSTTTSTSTGCVMDPMSNTDFLNGCNGLVCNPFDNKGRLPLYDGGALPTLP